MRRTVMQTAFTRDCPHDMLVTILRRYDRMLRKAEECLIRVQCLAKQAPNNYSTVNTDMSLILDDVSQVLDEELMTFWSPEKELGLE